MKLSIVMPIYNESRTLTQIVKLVEESLENLTDIISNYEIIMVDDYSSDGTIDLIKETYSNHSNVRSFFQTENQGKGAALKRGFQEVTGDIVLIQDADLEYDPADYRSLLTPIVENKADVVYGSRFKNENSRSCCRST